MTDPQGNSTSFTYDGNGNLLTVTDANTNVTQYDYDDMDRLVQRADPLGNPESYDYDAAGNLTTFIDRGVAYTGAKMGPPLNAGGTTSLALLRFRP